MYRLFIPRGHPRRQGFVMTTLRRILPVISLLALWGCQQTGSLSIPHGLHNSSKAFTAAADMQGSDWSDPAEMERAWQAALVRIPKPDGGYLGTTVANLQQDAGTPPRRMADGHLHARVLGVLARHAHPVQLSGP